MQTQPEKESLTKKHRQEVLKKNAEDNPSMRAEPTHWKSKYSGKLKEAFAGKKTPANVHDEKIINDNLAGKNKKSGHGEHTKETKDWTIGE